MFKIFPSSIPQPPQFSPHSSFHIHCRGELIVSNPALQAQTEALAKTELRHLRSNCRFLRGPQLHFSLEPMFLVKARFLPLREPDFVGLHADFRLGWSRFGLLWRVARNGDSNRSLRWFRDNRFAGTGGRVFSCVYCHNDVLSGPDLGLFRAADAARALQCRE